MKKRTANRSDIAQSSVGESWQDLIESAQALLQSLQDQKGEAVERLRDKLSSTLATAKERLYDLRSTAGDKGQQMAQSTVKYARDNPWKIVALVAVIALGWKMLSSGDDESAED
jgi:ElaB/YqjD/DUF883 family membrane-anchored ribosome-binding protein